MTLTIAWVREDKSIQELVLAADSRLRSVGYWDGCPKLFPLARGDAVIGFAGDTMHAYPLLLQVRNAIDMSPRARSRQLDLHDLKGFVIRVMNHMRAGEGFQLDGSDRIPSAAFLLAGYSWRKRVFRVWTIHYDHSIPGFTSRPATRWRRSGRKWIAFVGDDLFVDKETKEVERARAEFLQLLDRRVRRAERAIRFHVIATAKDQLGSLLRERGKLTEGSFDMEPLEVLRDMIRGDHWDSIGGPPQVVKVYPHMNAVPFAVYWPDRASGRISVFGREVMAEERWEYPILDPDSLR